MLDEGIVIVTSGTETVMVPLMNLNGSYSRPEGVATMNESPIERPATVFRLSSTRWLRDSSK